MRCGAVLGVLSAPKMPLSGAQEAQISAKHALITAQALLIGTELAPSRPLKRRFVFQNARLSASPARLFARY